MVPEKTWFHLESQKIFLESHFIYALESQKAYKYKIESQLSKNEVESQLPLS